MNQKIGVPVVGVISHPGHETEFALLTMRRRRRTHTAVNVHTHIIRGQGRSMSVFLEVNAPISLNNGAARTTTTVVQGSSQSHCTIFILWNGIVFQGRTLDFFLFMYARLLLPIFGITSCVSTVGEFLRWIAKLHSNRKVTHVDGWRQRHWVWVTPME